MGKRAKRASRSPSARRRPAAEAAAPAPPARKRTPNGSRARLKPGRLRAIALALGLSGALTSAALGLFAWSFWHAQGAGRVLHFEVLPNESPGSLSGRLAAEGLVSSPRLFATYVRVLNPSLALAPGKHVVRDDLSARELLRRLARVTGRGKAHLVVPEGFNHVQLAERLQELGVCDAEDFRLVVRDPAQARQLGIPADSAEGYLFPATYELLADSAPAAVAGVLVAEAQKRLARLQAEQRAGFEARRAEQGLSVHDVLTLASIIEKEAARDDEKPLIASVFLNRLSDASFRPRSMLQSDPTASYGCLVQSPAPSSCSGGKPSPAMLRDATNLYNTYRHAGLPPGPISSPGESAIRAVLAPAKSDYLYFVAQGGGRHRFSRTFSEHREAIENP